MLEAPSERGPVLIEDDVEFLIFPVPHAPHYGAGCGRDDRQRDEERSGQAEADRQSHRDQKFLDVSVREYHRHENADRRHGRGNDRRADLFCSLHRGSGRVDAQRPQPENILHDDYGVVHEHAYAQGQTRESHDIDRKPGEVHQYQREEHRKRDAYRHDERRPHISQEQSENYDGQYRSYEHAFQQVADYQRDVFSLVYQIHVREVRIFSRELVEIRRAFL